MKGKSSLFWIFILLCFGWSCDPVLSPSNPQATTGVEENQMDISVREDIDLMEPIDFDELIANYENKNRAEWQNPEDVIDYLGPISGKKVADIGAGSGYFSYRLLHRDAQVISTEIDSRFIQWLDDHVLELDTVFHNRFETRLVEAGGTGLGDQEVDAILMVNTLSYILQPVDYLQQLSRNLKPGGVLVIVDYKTQRIPVPAPKLEDRVILGEIEGLLMDAGFEKLIVEDCLLDFQWLIRAQLPE